MAPHQLFLTRDPQPRAVRFRLQTKNLIRIERNDIDVSVSSSAPGTTYGTEETKAAFDEAFDTGDSDAFDEALTVWTYSFCFGCE